jgi:glucosamine kinase
MILIADSGSTKTDWVFTNENNNRSRYRTIGYNPYFTDADNIYASLKQTLLPQLDASSVKTIFFYGAGCSSPDKAAVVHAALTRCFPTTTLFVKHDMLGAARALLADKPGFAAILGTGSNTCIYDGKEIAKNIDSLGYLLGDEGSGSSIGKKILRDQMRGYLPIDLNHKFKIACSLSPEEIYDTLYNKPLPNRFLASFCKFADENKEHEYIRNIVRESFTDFFKYLVSRYDGYENFSFNCIGSVGYIFSDILHEVALAYKMKIGKMLSSPIEDLVDYHIVHLMK